MKKVIIFLSPLIILLEINLFSWIVEMLRQPSDIAVLAGTLLLTVIAIGNFYLFTFINKTFKKK